MMEWSRKAAHSKTGEGHLFRLFTLLWIAHLLPLPAHSLGAAQTPRGITMTTDKTHYARGEIIKVQITNSLDVPIWYIGYSQRDLHFWEIERAQSNGWQRLQFRLPIIEGGKEVCRLKMYEQPIGAVTELKPHANFIYEWNQKVCVKMTPTKVPPPEFLERGRYRFSLRYSLEKVKTEDSKTKPWKRPIDLGGTKEVFSNEFVLE